MEERFDKWIGAMLGLVGGLWAGASMFFNLKARVDVAERNIKSLEETLNDKHDDLKQDIQAVAIRNEKRHDILETKIDRLIERSIPGAK